MASFGDDVREALRDEREAVIREGPLGAAPGVGDEHPPRQEPLLLRVFPDLALLPEIFFVPGGRTADDEGRRVDGVRLPEELGGISVERRIAERMLPAGLPIEDQTDVVSEVASLASDLESLLAGYIRDQLTGSRF